MGTHMLVWRMGGIAKDFFRPYANCNSWWGVFICLQNKRGCSGYGHSQWTKNILFKQL